MTARSSRAPFLSFAAAFALAVTPFGASAQDEAASPTAEQAQAQPADQLAPAAGSEAAPPENLDAYKAALMKRLQRQRLNTNALRDQGLRGEFSTLVVFTTGPDGRLISSRIGESSGNTDFDNLAMATLRRAEPFPAFSPDITEDSVTYSITLKAVLTDPVAPEVPSDVPAEGSANVPDAETPATPAAPEPAAD
ncbi:TonB C-terminal domain-containing protein [Xinfangfangia sp. D13-10-4-6]|uniref:TonB family protein n=1 Tax=Pseudogemmobacter hezensis TaxID=2737662 RepID=UPI00155715C0|nr:TonB family protein [Pseudogemmobacter hezensis]NPD17228.1 TonB C-terminal domain-containing protein [Pseudogemmobacter hezensis]